MKNTKLQIKREIIDFLFNHLQSRKWDQKMKDLISSFLHAKGKIFNLQSYFTWGEFCYYVSSVFNGDHTCPKKQIACAGAVELLILATDIIDDIADNDNDGETPIKLEIPQALMLSNALLMESFDIFLDYLPKDQLPIFHKIIDELKTASMGMWKDLSFTVSEHMPSEADYFALIDRKSVSLIRMIFELNDMRSESISVWEKAAKYMGYAGQLENDAKDILLDSKSDLIHKKATLPLIKAIEFSNEKDQGWLLRQIDRLDAYHDKKELLIKIREYIKKTGSIDYCQILSKVYLNKSIQMLKQSTLQNTETLIYYLEGENL